MAYSLQGLRYESVDSNKVTSHIPTVTVESHEAVDKISAYMDQRRAVHTRQLIPVLLTAKVNDKRLVAVYLLLIIVTDVLMNLNVAIFIVKLQLFERPRVYVRRL